MCPSSQVPRSRGDSRSPPSRWSSLEASSVASTSPTLTPSGWWWPTAMVGAPGVGLGFPSARWTGGVGGAAGVEAVEEVLVGVWPGAAWPDGMCWNPAHGGQMSGSNTRPGDLGAPEDWGWASPYCQSPHFPPSDLNAIRSLPELHRPTEGGGHPGPCRPPPEGLLPHADGQPGALSGEPAWQPAPGPPRGQ